MNRLLEQRYAVKFFLKLSKTASKTHELIKSSYGDNTMDVLEWHKLWWKRVSWDEQRPERPSTTKNDEN